jgi:hypothetical protein
MEDQTATQLPEKHPVQTSGVKAAMEAVYNWNYDPEIDQLRNLYAKSLDLQWVGMRDLDWDRGIDQDAFTSSFALGGIPITETRYWKNLPAETRWEVARRSACFLLSNFLHGEQGALMVAAQLVNVVPDMDGKFYAATQTLDEARHVEVFAAYLGLLDRVYPISEGLKKLLDGILSAEDWMRKTVGMQVVAEGLALYSFRDMRNQTQEPLLKKLLTLVARDEARHTGFGIQYLSRVVPTIDDRRRAELEDFAFEAVRLLIDRRAGNSMRDRIVKLWAEAGVDPEQALGAMLQEREVIAKALAERGGRLGPVSGFVIPTLKSIGLYSQRIHGHFQEMWSANMGEETARRLATSEHQVPEDLEAWVNEGYETA